MTDIHADRALYDLIREIEAAAKSLETADALLKAVEGYSNDDPLIAAVAKATLPARKRIGRAAKPLAKAAEYLLALREYPR
jgi:hypothetical protein